MLLIYKVHFHRPRRRSIQRPLELRARRLAHNLRFPTFFQRRVARSTAPSGLDLPRLLVRPIQRCRAGHFCSDACVQQYALHRFLCASFRAGLCFARLHMRLSARGRLRNDRFHLQGHLRFQRFPLLSYHVALEYCRHCRLCLPPPSLPPTPLRLDEPPFVRVSLPLFVINNSLVIAMVVSISMVMMVPRTTRLLRRNVVVDQLSPLPRRRRRQTREHVCAPTIESNEQ
jgi:hypothetical protein